MESLALFVGFMLLGMFIGGPVALGLSFIKIRFFKILAIVLAAPIFGLGLLMAFNADGSRNMIIIGLGTSAFAAGAVYNAAPGLRAKSELLMPNLNQD
jgi:hypothetical protein